MVFFTTHYVEETERVADRIAVIDRRGGAERNRRPQLGGRVHRADRAQYPRGRGGAGRPHARMMRQVWRGRQ
jgi:hypothetical protein